MERVINVYLATLMAASLAGCTHDREGPGQDASVDSPVDAGAESHVLDRSILYAEGKWTSHDNFIASVTEELSYFVWRDGPTSRPVAVSLLVAGGRGTEVLANFRSTVDCTRLMVTRSGEIRMTESVYGRPGLLPRGDSQFPDVGDADEPVRVVLRHRDDRKHLEWWYEGSTRTAFVEGDLSRGGFGVSASHQDAVFAFAYCDATSPERFPASLTSEMIQTLRRETVDPGFGNPFGNDFGPEHAEGAERAEQLDRRLRLEELRSGDRDR